MGPTVCLGLGAISMKVEWVQGEPLHSHTYAGTRDNTRQRAYMPATIVVARGLLSPMQWCGWRFSAAGQRVLNVYIACFFRLNAKFQTTFSKSIFKSFSKTLLSTTFIK